MTARVAGRRKPTARERGGQRRAPRRKAGKKPKRVARPSRRGGRWGWLGVAAGVVLLLVLSVLAGAAAFRGRDSGRGEERRKVAIPEGWTSFQIARRLAEKDICPDGAFVAATRDPELLAEFGIVGPSVEGYLFPATYEFAPGSDPDEVLRSLVREGRRRVGEIFARSEAGFRRLHDELGWGEGEVLTLASIVEKEAIVDEERPLIARVYLNRLTDPDFRPAKRLQADPTAGYGCLVSPGAARSCAGYDGRITPAMLRDSANRYNTYRHPGLPPGPIANPGAASITAVLEPADSDYLYFVAAGQGRHVFSRTFAEHKAAIQRLRK